MAYRAVIFDLDGTLLDTLDDIADSANKVLTGRGLPPHPVDDYRFFVGDGVKKLVERILPPGERSESLVEKCLLEMREEYGRNWNVKTRPYDGIPELLASLEDLGLKRAVLSNKPDELTQVCVAELLSVWTFDAVAGHSELTPHKPHPAGAEALAHRLEVEPAEIVLVGDSDIDMKTAVNAGMYPAGATWGFRPREELVAAGARALLDRPADLLAILDNEAN
jgi:phosphoglycolate phosphatase